ncbi:hypothetical protein DPMN_152310 [Dreissena polymorpha]|uniref:Uncharacterized protein n=1 Tax=Dreissena polymorpha TaxID=45954 RepID=A0A9D4J7T1_DREPO|nr:hypothetical protein DPMN_152310 [Dreissena polymorpha]
MCSITTYCPLCDSSSEHRIDSVAETGFPGTYWLNQDDAIILNLQTRIRFNRLNLLDKLLYKLDITNVNAFIGYIGLLLNTSLYL